MIQLYFLSISYIFISSLIILPENLKRQLSFLILFRERLREVKRARRLYFLAGVAIGLGTLLFPVDPGPWIIGDFMRLLGESKTELADCKIRPESLAAMVDLIQSGAINGKIAKTVFEEMFRTGKEPGAIVKEKGLVQVSDESAITGFVDQVIAANPNQVQQYRDGKTAVIQYLVGQVMKASRGKANPQMVLKLLTEKLSS